MSNIKGLKKTIVYSSEKERDFIEGALNILSIIEKKSASSVLEDLLHKVLLPENVDAKEICKKLYAGEINNMEALEKVFDIYAAGTCNEARYQNGFELILYFHKQIAFSPFPYDKKSEENRQFFCHNFMNLYKKIEKECATEHEEDMLVYESQVKYAKYHLDEAACEPEHFKPINLTDIIKENWNILGNYTYTYRTLAALCRLIAPTKSDSPEERIKLIELISRLSKKWN